MNWWNVNQYRQEVEEPQDELPGKVREEQDADDELKKKNHLYSNIQNGCSLEEHYRKKGDARVDRIIPSDIGWSKFDSRLHSKDYAAMKQLEKQQDQHYQVHKAVYKEMKSVFDQHQYYDNYNPQKKEKKVLEQEDVRPGSKYSQRQMLKGMQSQMDSHNYYQQMLTAEPKKQSPLKEVPSNIPKQLYVNLVVRGASSKLDWKKVKESLKGKECNVGSVLELKQASGKIVHQVTLSSLRQEALDEAELFLFSQGMRVVSKQELDEAEFAKLVKPKAEPKKNNKVGVRY